MANVLKAVKKINRKKLQHARREDILNEKFEGIDGPIDTQHLLISTLLPPAVKMFIRDCVKEVEQLCGERYKHGKQNLRWGDQKGSIILANQQVAVPKLRVRSKSGEEVPLKTYEQFQDPGLFNQAVFTEGLKRVSQRDYEKGVLRIASSFGFKKSSISRRWIKATANKLAELQSRSLKEMDIRAVYVDGKRFRKHGVIVALGVAADGRKYVLGIYQADTENHGSCLELLNDLERRGLPASGLLFIVDGGSGLNKALNMKYACNDNRRKRPQSPSALLGAAGCKRHGGSQGDLGSPGKCAARFKSIRSRQLPRSEGRSPRNPRTENVEAAQACVLDNKSDRIAQLADRRRHEACEEVAKLRALPALARHLLPTLRKENASCARVQSLARTLGATAYDV
jgi:hypothetical protein